MEGRIDIVIFTNGKKEIIGRISSIPEIPMNELLIEVNKFIRTKQNLESPEKFTGKYNPESEQLEIIWKDWEGEIEKDEEDFSPELNIPE